MEIGKIEIRQTTIHSDHFGTLIGTSTLHEFVSKSLVNTEQILQGFIIIISSSTVQNKIPEHSSLAL